MNRSFWNPPYPNGRQFNRNMIRTVMAHRDVIGSFNAPEIKPCHIAKMYNTSRENKLTL